MSIKALLLLIVGIIIVCFMGLNWGAMTTPNTLSLGFAEVTAPLGLVLLGLIGLLCIIFIAIMAYTQGTVLVEARRHAKELAAQRELADKAEASRFTDLRAHLDAEVLRLSQSIESQSSGILARTDRVEMGLTEQSQSQISEIKELISKLTEAVEKHNHDLHARVDRLEMGLHDDIRESITTAHISEPAYIQKTEDVRVIQG